MKSILLRLATVSLICCAAAFCAQAQQAEPPLTNTAVVKLVRAGFKEKTVIAIIQSRPNRFSLDPDRLIELKRQGVSENIILTMLAQNDSFVFTDDDWIDNSGFRGSASKGSDGSKGQSGGTDIFGSGSGSRSQSNGRGVSGGNDTETTTTGSATVRILRPAAEPGGAASMKMEKTPTLTNDAVIKLVEAGFSEGTIIKRIEDSPADFDLSGPKLEELRRKRVTDAIISAMTAAMGDESIGSPTRKGN
jgi:hypothetical protein